MYRILVADDEPIERQVINKKILGFFPDQVLVFMAENGIEAVSAFEDNDCQIAILDIEMPGMNGLDAAAQIRKKHPDCSIIFLTAFDEFNYAKRAIEVRALDYLLKPGSDEDLINVIEEAMRLADREEEAFEEAASEDQAVAKDISFAEAEDTTGDEEIASNIIVGEVTRYIENNYKKTLPCRTWLGFLATRMCTSASSLSRTLARTSLLILMSSGSRGQKSCSQTLRSTSRMSA